MPLREKLKKTFSSKKSRSGDSASNDTSPPARTDIEYYKPHEIPKSKYRGKVEKAHQEKLDAYSFADAFQTIRRKTSQALSGTLSPGGTGAQSAAQSRRSSWISRTNKSSLCTAATSNGDDGDNVFYRRKSVASVGAPRESKLEEDDEEDGIDPINTGRLRTATTDNKPSIADRQNVPELRIEKTTTLGAFSSSLYDAPFSAEALEKAMTRATLRPRSGTAIVILPEQIAAGA